MSDSDTAAGAGSRPRLPPEIWVLVSASFVIALGYGIVAPVLPQFARSFGVGVTAASAVISAFALMRLLFAPAAGRLVQRSGERPVYLLGLLIVAFSTGACAFANGYWQLLVFRGLGGIGSTMFTVSALGLLIRISPPEQPRSRLGAVCNELPDGHDRRPGPRERAHRVRPRPARTVRDLRGRAPDRRRGGRFSGCGTRTSPLPRPAARLG